MRMRGRGAYIVTFQEDPEINWGIEHMRDPRSPNHVVYTTITAEVLIEVIERPVDVVIAGEAHVGNSPDVLRRLRLAWDRMLAGRRKAGGAGPPLPAESIKGATHLSRLIYEIDPGVLVIRFTGFPLYENPGPFPATMPRDEDGCRIVGDLPKPCRKEEVFGLFDSPSLGKIVRHRDWAGMRRKFPQVIFYCTLERDHGYRV